MGLCCNSSKSRNKTDRINSLNISKFKKNYYTEGNSSIFVSTAAASSKPSFTPEIYTLNKFGIQVKTKQKITQPLKFIFHLYNFKCKMLTENTLYILQIIFDGKEFPLSFGNGNNPSFIFNETFGKEIVFEKMEKSFLEIYLYTHKKMLNNIQNLTKGEILAESQIFSCFKINLLTLALAPEKHDLKLIDPKRMRVHLGRISYCISCKHIEDLYLKIIGFKINLKKLKYNEIALNLKFENKNFRREKESQYSDNFIGIPNNKENSMIYEFSNDKDDDLDQGISEDSSYLISEDSKNIQKELEKNKNEKNNINNNIRNNINTDNTFRNMNYNLDNNNKLSEKLFIHGKMSINELYNSDITLNLFSVRLQNTILEKDTEKENLKENEEKENLSDKVVKKQFFMKKIDLPEIAKNSCKRKSKQSNAKLNLINSYELIGISSLNFNIILHELEGKLSKISYRLFQSMSNKKNGMAKSLSGSKIMKFGIEEDLTNKHQSNKNLYNINSNNEFQCRIQNLTINLFESDILVFNEEIYWEGELIGTIEINLEIINLPLLRQIRFGVMTETGFEINSIFLYDNLNISNDLPEELLELIKLKEKFEQDIDFSILKKIKLCLEKTIEENFLYYGYSSNEDLYQGQAVIINLGLGLFDLIDKVNFEYLHQIFEILKLILRRSEFDLGTLSAKWFKPKKVIKKKQSTYCIKNASSGNNSYSFFNYDEVAYEFHDIYLIEKHLIEKYLHFHSEILNFCLNNLNKGKNINKESMDFTYFYLSMAFLQIPPYRDSLIQTINKSINLKDQKYVKFSSINYMNFSKSESSNINPNSNLMLWDTLFYQRLDSSINIYINDLINKDNIENKKNNNNNRIENINAIKEQLMNIKYITEIKEDNKKNIYDFYQKNWYVKLSKRDFVFYDLITELFHFLNIIKNKLYMNSNQTNSFPTFQNQEKMTNISGIKSIINAINYDLLVKDAKNYPKQIKEIIPKFYSDIGIINNFICIMLSTTNVYDTLSIFSLLEILDYLFNKKYNYLDFNEEYIKDNIDYSLIKKSFFIIVNSDNSLAIAKFIWFYYKNISLLSYQHINEIITYIITNLFFKLFFHWSFQVREIFYFFIIFILGFKIKKQIMPKKDDKKDNNNEIITHIDLKKTFNKKMTFNIFGNINEELNKKLKKVNQFYYIENDLNENMNVIKRLQRKIEKENFNLIYMDNIEKIKDKTILEKIPEDPHGNIVECIKQYNNNITKFDIWKKNIEDNKITEDKIEYPNMEISIIKDDTIQYEM